MGNRTSAMLDGLRVVEVGHFVAAPFASRLLADLGADVIKVEPLRGDPVRSWGEQVDGRSLWWSVHGRNKRCITLDLKQQKGRELLLDLVAGADAVIENFRPGQIERMGIGPDVMRKRRPDLVIARISGYGQDGPQRDRAAFGVIGEAIGGLRHLTNDPPGTTGRAPVRVGVSIGDSIAGLYAAFGIMSALWSRARASHPAATIDVALSESVLSMMEGLLPEYGRLGKIKQPTGGGIATAAPSNAYPTADGGWVLIAANSDPIFDRLAALIGDELQSDASYRDNRGRVAHAARLDAAIRQWTNAQSTDALLAALDAADIPSSKIYTAADCANDEQYRARGMVREVADPGLGSVLHPGVVPHVPEAPGSVRWPGPGIGAHNEEVLRELCDQDTKTIEALRAQRVIL